MLNELTTAETIQLLMKREKINKTELANMLGISRTNLSNQLDRNNFPEKVLRNIADNLGYNLKIEFIKKEPV